jgi:hypothetical protein
MGLFEYVCSTQGAFLEQASSDTLKASMIGRKII